VAQLCAIALVGVLVLLSMYMIDRQWRKMATMQTIMNNQAEDLRALRNSVRDVQGQIKQGIQVTGLGGAATDDMATPTAFARAAAVANNEDYAEGDWLVDEFSANIKTITPLVSADVDASTVQGYVLETLLLRNPETLGWDGLLAESWQVSDDGMAIDFTLRDNIVFSDGTPLTVHDVKFSFEYIMDDRIEAPRNRQSLKKIDRVEVLSDQVVRFVFAEPYFESLGLAGSMSILAKHFY